MEKIEAKGRVLHLYKKYSVKHTYTYIVEKPPPVAGSPGCDSNTNKGRPTTGWTWRKTHDSRSRLFEYQIMYFIMYHIDKLTSF